MFLRRATYMRNCILNYRRLKQSSILEYTTIFDSTNKQLKNKQMKAIITIFSVAFIMGTSFGQQINKPAKDTYQETINPDVSTFDLATRVTPNPTIDKVAIMWYGQQKIDKVLLIKADQSEILPVHFEEEQIVVVHGLTKGLYFVKFYFKGQVMSTEKLLVQE